MRFDISFAYRRTCVFRHSGFSRMENLVEAGFPPSDGSGRVLRRFGGGRFVCGSRHLEFYHSYCRNTVGYVVVAAADGFQRKAGRILP